MREVAIRETFCIKIPSAISGTNPSTKAPGTISGTTAPCPIDVVPEIVPAMSLEMVIVPEIVPGLLMEKLFVPGIAPEAKCMDAVVPEIVPKVPCKGTPLCPEPCAGFCDEFIKFDAPLAPQAQFLAQRVHPPRTQAQFPAQ